MILTCPRCATRYLVDERHVWTTGRTVQCEACGQRWRATGSGEAPSLKPPTVEPALDPEAPAAATFPAFTPLDGGGRLKSTPAAIVEPEGRPTMAEEPLVAPSLFRAVPARSKPVSPHGPAGLGRALAIVFIILVILGGLVLFRDAIVQAAPGLAPVYKALGLDQVSLVSSVAHV